MSLKQKSPKIHKKSFVLGLAVFVALGYAAFNLIAMQVEIAQKASEYEELTEKLNQLQTENEQLERYSNEEYRLSYIEEIAREELDYSYADEKIYYFVPSN